MNGIVTSHAFFRRLKFNPRFFHDSVHIAKDKKLTVALVGRPNVGKSTLFNRLTDSKRAIVSNVPGTTRDRKVGEGYLIGLPLQVIDTGGLDDRGAVHQNIQLQVESAILDADVIIFLLDSKEGVTALDLHFASWIRKRLFSKTAATDKSATNINHHQAKKDIILVANKAEGGQSSDRVLNTISDALHLGLGHPLLISASHGDGMTDLFEQLNEAAKLRDCVLEEDAKEGGRRRHSKDDLSPISVEDRTIQLAVMGRPNVGKSSFINSILEEERLIAGPTPGLTRDAIHINWTFKDRSFLLVDTAGLTKIKPNIKLLTSAEEKKKAREMELVGKFDSQLPGLKLMDPEEDPSQFSQQVAQMALISALNALRFAQVVLLMVDSEQGRFSKIDLQLARKCLTEGRALVIAANKADLVNARGVKTEEYVQGVESHCLDFMKEFGEVPVIACVATERKGVDRALQKVIETHDAWSKRISTWVLNRWLKDTLLTVPAARAAGRNINIKYITQVKSRPPTFALFSNVSELPSSFERFLRSRIQADMKLQGVPIRFIVRKTKGNATQQALLKNSLLKRKSGRGNESSKPVGPKRKTSQYYLIKVTRDKRLKRRKRDTRLRRKQNPKKPFVHRQ